MTDLAQIDASPRVDTIRVYRDSLGEWRWTRRAPAGRTLAESPAGWADEHACRAAARIANPDTNYRIETARD